MGYLQSQACICPLYVLPRMGHPSGGLDGGHWAARRANQAGDPSCVCLGCYCCPGGAWLSGKCNGSFRTRSRTCASYTSSFKITCYAAALMLARVHVPTFRNDARKRTFRNVGTCNWVSTKAAAKQALLYEMVPEGRPILVAVCSHSLS